jgi:hypothetical protein
MKGIAAVRPMRGAKSWNRGLLVGMGKGTQHHKFITIDRDCAGDACVH